MGGAAVVTNVGEYIPYAQCLRIMFCLNVGNMIGLLIFTHIVHCIYENIVLNFWASTI